ncbi:MAG: hypothetical protein PHC63_08340 [Candidatus Bathyarchaeota archaeon]|nr:hypothetical protein [Candidatus Bathyarchaeota archaeon]
MKEKENDFSTKIYVSFSSQKTSVFLTTKKFKSPLFSGRTTTVHFFICCCSFIWLLGFAVNDETDGFCAGFLLCCCGFCVFVFTFFIIVLSGFSYHHLALQVAIVQGEKR